MHKKLFNKILAILTSILLLVGLVPSTTVAVMAAEEDGPGTLWVVRTQITAKGYWKTTNEGNFETGSESDYNVYYDGNGTLTLNDATIQGGTSIGSVPYGAGIYAQCSEGQSVALTIKLIGENTITGLYGIYVNAEISADSNGTNATLTITGDNNGSLGVSGSDHGIYVKSGTSNASINIKNVAVTSSTNGNSAAGVYVMSSANATNSPNISLSVNGGSLTASGTESSDGILFYVGSSQAIGATTSLTVSENAIVDARNGGISASRISETLPTPTPTVNNSSGIVFDGTEGTVYGNVTLNESITINQDETLRVPNGSSFQSNNNLTNSGTIIVENGGALTGEVNGKVIYAPSITTESLPEGKVNEEYSTSLSASGSKPIGWSLTQGSLPTGFILSIDGKITGTATAPGDYVFTVTASNDAGSISKELTINIKDVDPIYSIKNSGDISFTDALEGYTPEVKTLTITNDGNQPITLEQPVSSELFEVGTLSKTELNAGQTAEFTVQPKTGLSAGSYNENIVITGINNGKLISTTVNVKFNVKHVHSYGEPTWEWANDNMAKAIFKCEKGDDTQNLSGIMSSKITKDATCDAKGIRTYTAKVTFGGKEYTATKDIEIPALSCNTSQGNDQPYDDGGPFTRNECGDVFDRWGNLIYDAPDCVVKPKPTTSPQTTLKPENTTEATLEPVKTEEPEQSVEPEKTTTPKPTIQASSTPDSDVKVEKENSFGFIWWILGGIGVVIVGIVAYLVIKNNTEDDE